MHNHTATRREFLVALSAAALLTACGGGGAGAPSIAPSSDETAPTPIPTSPEGVLALTAPRSVAWSDFLGINAQLLWFSPAQVAQQLQLLKELGLSWVRVDVHWALLEPTPGQYQWAPLDAVVALLAQMQLQSVFYLVGSTPFASSAPPGASNSDQYPPTNPQTFAQTLAALARRYPGVTAWQVWNEPNLPTFWQPAPNAAGYAQLFQASQQALEQAAPGHPVVLAGMAYYSQIPGSSVLMLQELASLGTLGLGGIVAYHPYSQYPEGDDPQVQDFVVRADQLNSSLRTLQVPSIWATEWGWSSYPGPYDDQPIIGTAGQADFVLRRLALMSAMDFDRIFLFTLSDLDSRASSIRDQFYGLLDLQGNPKPVYTALSYFFGITGPVLHPGVAPTLTAAPSALYSIAWVKPDGTKLWMFWSRNAGVIQLSGITSAALFQPITGTSSSMPVAQGQASFAAAQQLQILAWT